MALNPEPRTMQCTLHPTPYTLHPTPYTLHPTPYTLHPTPYALNLKPCTLNPVGRKQRVAVSEVTTGGLLTGLARFGIGQPL
jgi:hypothetical protein